MAESFKDDYDTALENSLNTLQTYISSGEWSIVKQTVWIFNGEICLFILQLITVLCRVELLLAQCRQTVR